VVGLGAAEDLEVEVLVAVEAGAEAQEEDFKGGKR